MQYLYFKNKAGTKQNKRIEVVEEEDQWEGREGSRGWCEVDKIKVHDVCVWEYQLKLIILFNE